MEKTENINPCISIVIPVYKAEKHLRACVESVLAQTFTDFELILVDDGSPDKSGELCDELARLDSRIRVFHQENGGVTSARKLGVEKARGEWICFADADDLLPSNSLKDLIDVADDDTDWVQGQFVRFNDGEIPKTKKLRVRKTVKSIDVADLPENVLTRGGHLWKRIVRKKLFSPRVLDIPRDIGVCEDMLASLRLVANKPRNMKEISSVVYLYRQQENSVSHLCLRTENYTLRYAKLLFSEARKFSNPRNKKRLSVALSRALCGSISWNIGYGLPIKFPHRLATLMWPATRSRPEFFFVYLCLRFNCLGIARVLSKIYSVLSGRNLDPKTKTIVD